eukprot:2021601-Pleurochrysis_carterae.AAC.2
MGTKGRETCHEWPRRGERVQDRSQDPERKGEKWSTGEETWRRIKQEDGGVRVAARSAMLRTAVAVGSRRTDQKGVEAQDQLAVAVKELQHAVDDARRVDALCLELFHDVQKLQAGGRQRCMSARCI